MLFQLGRLILSSEIANTIKINPDFQSEIDKSMERYINGDWGEFSEHDANMNDCAIIENHDLIYARYDTSQGEVWFITEWDRSCTKILFSHE
ncbi:MAG: hypothetical protein LBD23_14750 [Oscillospiraceae bacterium]|jgi:hypothetical protein|nr:hypothetical protein [Oscillospiraceae bacterium]